jgi:hypothetical protein
MSVLNALGCTFVVKIQASKLAGVGTVPKAEIDRIGSVVHGGFKGGETASRAYKFHGFLR